MIRWLQKKITPNNEKTKLKHLKHQCKHAVTTLLLLQKKHRARHCILVIGQPESGKSTLCASSGTLLFSSAYSTSLSKTPYTFAFEIYEQHHTLFFHIPQDFFLFSEAGQKHAWRFLTAYLKQQYAHLPITHCLVCMDIHDCLTRSKISNDTRLSQITLAINTMAKKLKAPFNISLFFTKADLITGFNEFFDHHNKEYLEQPWSISLTHPEILAEEYDQLIKRLNEQLLWRMHHEINPEHLYLIKSFPSAMAAIKQKLLEVLSEFLKLSTKSQQIATRNIDITQLYFVSCRQFRELKEATQEKSITTRNAPTSNQKCFFTHQALKNLCRYQVTYTISYLEKTTRIIFIIFSALLLLAFISFTAKQFSQHLALARTANNTLQQGRIFVKQPLIALNLKKVDAELQILHNTLNMLKKDQQSLLIGRFIFTDDVTLAVQLEKVYQNIMTQQWLPIICQQLENFVRTNLTTQPEQAYIAFKIYLMLSQPSTALDISYINLHLSNLLNHHAIVPQLSQLSRLKNHAQQEFIKKCREYFSSLPADKLAYILLFSNLDTYSPMNLSDSLEKSTGALEISKQYAFIPEIYTEKMFTTLYKKQLLNIVHETLQGNSVIGKLPTQANMTEEILLSQLQEEYIHLYRDAWEQALKHTQLAKTETLQDLMMQIQTLSSVDSPILSLLKLSQTNTAFPEIEQASPFLTAFNNTLTPQSTPENSVLFHSFIFIKNLNAHLLIVQKSTDPKTSACNLLKQEYAATEQHPTDAQQIRFLATQLPEPIQTWLQQLVDAYYAALNQQAVDCG